MLEIEKIENGYLLHDKYGRKKCFKNIQLLFKEILLIFEGKSDIFGGDLFGEVKINYICQKNNNTGKGE